MKTQTAIFSFLYQSISYEAIRCIDQSSGEDYILLRSKNYKKSAPEHGPFFDRVQIMNPKLFFQIMATVFDASLIPNSMDRKGPKNEHRH